MALPHAACTSYKETIALLDQGIAIVASLSWPHHLEALALQVSLFASFLQVVIDHLVHHFFQAGAGGQPSFSLARVGSPSRVSTSAGRK